MIDPTRLEPIASQIFVEDRPDSKPLFCDAFRRSKLLGLFVKDFGIGQGSRACANQEGTWLTAQPFFLIVQVFLKCTGGGSVRRNYFLICFRLYKNSIFTILF